MKDLPPEELKQLAVDFHHGLVFHDQQIPASSVPVRANELTMVFMPFLFMDQEALDKINNDPPGLIFEYYSKALPRGVNGRPMFVSCRMLSRDDTNRLAELCRKLAAAEKSALE